MTDHEEILAGFTEILKEATAGAVQNVTAEKSFAEDLDIDSLTMVEVAVMTEQKFGVKVPQDALVNLKTVEDAVNYISANSQKQ